MLTACSFAFAFSIQLSLWFLLHSKWPRSTPTGFRKLKSFEISFWLSRLMLSVSVIHYFLFKKLNFYKMKCSLTFFNISHDIFSCAFWKCLVKSQKYFFCLLCILLDESQHSIDVLRNRLWDFSWPFEERGDYETTRLTHVSMRLKFFTRFNMLLERSIFGCLTGWTKWTNVLDFLKPALQY